MAFVTTNKYTLDGTGTEIPSVDLSIDVQQYIITGTAIATGNYSIVPTGTPYQGSKVIITYSGTLDITTNTKTFSVFGQSITQNFLISQFEAECTYDGAAWSVLIKPNIANFSLGSSTIGANAIATFNLQDGSVTHPKLANICTNTNNLIDYCVTQSKLGLNSVGLNQLIVNSVDSTILADNSVINSKIPVNTITNNKFVNAPTHSIKIADASGLVQDLQLPANQIPMSNGSTIVGIDRGSIVTSITNSQLTPGGANSVKITDNTATVVDVTIGTNQFLGRLSGNLGAQNLSSVLSGTYETINTVVSFESGEQGTSYIYLPYSCTIVAMSGSVVKALSGTDNGTVALYDSVTRTLVDTMTIPLSSTLFTLIEDNAINYNFATFGGIGAPFSKIYLAPTKTTAGGKIAISILVRRA